MAPAALTGLRILDLSRVLAGPWATQLLGDLGAEVTKVERPGQGDETRFWGPPYLAGPDGGASGESAYYLGINRNKRSVAIDLANPRGQDLVRALARQSDVLVENFKPGDLARYGLDYATLAAEQPGLIYCSITGFGQTGPARDRPGYDMLMQAACGLMSVTGEPDGQPMKVGVAVVDLFTGLYAAVAILAALRARDQGGSGQHIDLALLDVGVATLANQAMNYLVGGRPPARQGNDHPNVVPYGVFATADGHLVLAVGNDRQFERFWQTAGLAERAVIADYRSNLQRVAARTVLLPLLRARLREETTATWLERLQAAEVPCGRVNNLAEVFAEPQVQARGLRMTLPHATGVPLPQVANPIRLSGTPPSYRCAAPLRGQDTAAVLGERLGLSAQELRSLASAGVLELGVLSE